MKKSLLFISLVLITMNLHAYVDNDMDGVEDSVDKCPNTLLTDLADINGCSIQSLVSPHRYNIIVGLNYSDTDTADTLSTSLQVDYYYKQFSIQASTSYFTTEGDKGYSESGLYDSIIGVSYRLKKMDNLSVAFRAGLILPTYDTDLNNNNIDYTGSINLSYALKSFNIFGGYSYTIINDDDTLDKTYQNTNTFSGGLGYYVSNKLYMSASYLVSDSIYRGVEDMQTASIYGYYSIDKDLFTTLSYAYGLSDSASDNYVSLRLGYMF